MKTKKERFLKLGRQLWQTMAYQTVSVINAVEAEQPPAAEGVVEASHEDGVRPKFSYGGQAVMEGVMMRGAYNMAVAVRNPKEEIVIHEQEINSALYRGRISKMPFVRGLTLLWDSLGLGTRALMWSADIALEEEEDVSFDGPLGYGTVAVSLAMGVGLFFLLPVFASRGVESLLGVDATQEFLPNLIEGIIRLLLIVGYMAVIGRLPDIARVFQYHGAEHKTINAYEDGAEMTPESVDTYPVEHPRCGTGFILVVAVISILVFAMLGNPPLLWRLISRVLLVPVIAGIAYEYIKFTAARMNNPLVRVLTVPSLALQNLTTNKPDLAMLEVSITSLKRVLEAEKAHQPESVEASASTAASAAK